MRGEKTSYKWEPKGSKNEGEVGRKESTGGWKIEGVRRKKKEMRREQPRLPLIIRWTYHPAERRRARVLQLYTDLDQRQSPSDPNVVWMFYVNHSIEVKGGLNKTRLNRALIRGGLSLSDESLFVHTHNSKYEENAYLMFSQSALCDIISHWIY